MQQSPVPAPRPRLIPLLLAASLSIACATSAQPTSPTSPDPDAPPSPSKAPSPPAPPAPTKHLTPAEVAKQKDRLTAEFLRHFKASAFADAAPIARQIIALDDWDFVPRYNLAACLAQLGDIDAAATSLREAVEHGFVEFDVMARDKNLASLRQHPTYRALLAKWPEVQERIADQKLERTKSSLPSRGKGYVTQKDRAMRLVFLSAFPEPSFKAALAEMHRVERFWQNQVLPDGTSALSTDDRRPDPWVMVWLPSPADYKRWVMEHYNTVQLGGIYDHDNKQLVTQDLGPILRHEYLHALHWRHMMRTGFIQPAWVQEGLCSLVEDVQEQPDTTLKPLPSWRTNTLRTMAKANVLPTWDSLFALTPERFIESRGLANYAVARSIFLFLSDQNKLRPWYAHYSAAADPNPRKSFEAVFDAPIAEVEKQWRAWVKALPEAPDASMNIPAILPFALEAAGDGVKITELATPDARRSGLRPGDIITHIDTIPIRDLNEYARLLSSYKPGDEVTLSYRRGTNTTSASARLKLIANTGG